MSSSGIEETEEWQKALHEWNDRKGQGLFCMPKRGTKAYREVLAIVKEQSGREGFKHSFQMPRVKGPRKVSKKLANLMAYLERERLKGRGAPEHAAMFTQLEKEFYEGILNGTE